MKLNKFLVGILGLMAFTACSSDEPLNNTNPTNPDEAAFSDNYLSVSLQMPTAVGGRTADKADNDYDKYDFDTAKESEVSNIFFLFFDSNDNVVDVQKIDSPTFKDDKANKNPYVTSYGLTEIRLRSGLDYHQVAVVLNSSLGDVNDLRAEINTLAQLKARVKDYITGQIKNDGSNQVMSNSVYFDKLDEKGESTYSRTTTPDAEDEIILVPITKDNIYTSLDKSTITEEKPIPDGKKAVEIYVERVVAKVRVESKLDMKDYYVSKGGEGDDAVTKKTITLYDNLNLTTTEVEIEPVILGVALNVLTPSAKLIKPIDVNQVGYGVGDSDNYKDFQWNDPLNKRSYWANTSVIDKKLMTYLSWNEAKGKNVTNVEGDENKTSVSTFTQYIHPNTMDFKPTQANESNPSRNTKVMVVAQLKAKDKDGKLVKIDFVRYGGDYMEASNLKALAANTVNVAVRNINWEDVTLRFTPAEAVILNTVVTNAFVDGTTAAMYKLGILNPTSSTADYEAKVYESEDFKYELTVDKSLFDDYADEDVHAILDATAKDDNGKTELDRLIDRAKDHINKIIADALASVNVPRILYWKDGMTYFYTTIKQQGFYGLVGGGTDNYLNGVVRNHYYQISLDGIYGLGTPVIEPGRPIDPERPEIDRPNYLTARINVLPWRIVTNSATIH